MILCHEYRFIFLKTSKTAGTSVEIGLSRFCGPDDIITSLVPNDEQLRSSLGGRPAQNYRASHRDYRPRDIARLLVRGAPKLRYHSHIQAAEVREAVGEKIWNSYYKFSFERNPWDRVVSHYYWRTMEPRPPLHDFIERKAGILKDQGWNLYTVDDQVAVDRVCLYEYMEDELRVIRDQIGLTTDIEIPHAKGGHRPIGHSYQSVMTAQDRELVATIFHKEIEMFGYEF